MADKFNVKLFFVLITILIHTIDYITAGENQNILLSCHFQNRPCSLTQRNAHLDYDSDGKYMRLTPTTSLSSEIKTPVLTEHKSNVTYLGLICIQFYAKQLEGSGILKIYTQSKRKQLVWGEYLQEKNSWQWHKVMVYLKEGSGITWEVTSRTDDVQVAIDNILITKNECPVQKPRVFEKFDPNQQSEVNGIINSIRDENGDSFFSSDTNRTLEVPSNGLVGRGCLWFDYVVSASSKNGGCSIGVAIRHSDATKPEPVLWDSVGSTNKQWNTALLNLVFSDFYKYKIVFQKTRADSVCIFAVDSIAVYPIRCSGETNSVERKCVHKEETLNLTCPQNSFVDIKELYIPTIESAIDINGCLMPKIFSLISDPKKFCPFKYHSCNINAGSVLNNVADTTKQYFIKATWRCINLNNPINLQSTENHTVGVSHKFLKSHNFPNTTDLATHEALCKINLKWDKTYPVEIRNIFADLGPYDKLETYFENSESEPKKIDLTQNKIAVFAEKEGSIIIRYQMQSSQTSGRFVLEYSTSLNRPPASVTCTIIKQNYGSAAATAGIVVAIIAILLLLSVLVVFVYKKRSNLFSKFHNEIPSRRKFEMDIVVRTRDLEESYTICDGATNKSPQPDSSIYSYATLPFQDSNTRAPIAGEKTNVNLVDGNHYELAQTPAENLSTDVAEQEGYTKAWECSSQQPASNDAPS